MPETWMRAREKLLLSDREKSIETELIPFRVSVDLEGDSVGLGTQLVVGRERDVNLVSHAANVHDDEAGRLLRQDACQTGDHLPIIACAPEPTGRRTLEYDFCCAR